MSTSRRKIEHLDLCAKEEVESYGSGFEDIVFIHRAIPEMDKNSIDTKVSLIGKKLAAPILIASMTGGHPETLRVNRNLAEAAEALGLGIGVGSQRAALEDPAQEESFRVVRDAAPNAFVYGNIGAAQLQEYGVEGVERAIEMIDADAIAIHLNFLQEAIQPEGDVDASGILALIMDICSSIKVPVIVKETGAGIAHQDAVALIEAGVAAIDVGGRGGTSWARVEVYRAQAEGNSLLENLGLLYWDWGIPTAASVVECATAGNVPVIATGGVRSGLDVAKAIALGARCAGVALPLVAPAMQDSGAVVECLSRMIEELRVAMFLTGSPDVDSLSRAQIIFSGKTREMLLERGFHTHPFARR